jgi:GNAT superfamily N-acetyltransferase
VAPATPRFTLPASLSAGNPSLPPGYSPVAPGQLAQIVTFLEMTEPPAASKEHAELALDLRRFSGDALDDYRRLFRAVGEDWLWSSRLETADETLRAILGDPRVEAYAVREGDRDVGLVELDFREAAACELSFFGLTAGFVGRGFGRRLMRDVVRRAWAKPIRRFWVHTCTLDHPAALAFYCRCGFRPYGQAVEVSNDPRVSGHIRPDAAPHIPMIRL